MARRKLRPTSALRLTLAVLGLGVAGLLGCYFFVEARALPRLRTVEGAPHTPVALVFGAGLIREGEPSKVLQRRLDTGIALYQAHKVDQLLLSGNSELHHDEVRAMRRYALAHGVPAAALREDEEGLSTFDSCLRARDIFGVSRVILVTQRFHLPRALYLARALGMDATGVAADPASHGLGTFSSRELWARPWALWLAGSAPPRR